MRAYDTQFEIVADYLQQYKPGKTTFPRFMFLWVKQEQCGLNNGEYIKALVVAINTYSMLYGTLSYEDFVRTFKKVRTKEDCVRWVNEA